jgi:hypothetical protein
MIRLGSIVIASANIIILFYLVKKLFSQRAALISVFLFTSSIYLNIISGFFMLPDTPQMFFVLLALYYGLPVVLKKETNRRDHYNFLLFGFFSGLAFLSKYHSLFLWLGFGIYIILHNRIWLRKPTFYLSALITIILMIPVFYWNFNNHFISFTFHGSRVDIFNSPLNLRSFLQFFFGQIFYQNPILFVLFVVSLVGILRRKQDEKRDLNIVLIYLSFPLIVIFTVLSLFRNTFPHWTGPVFVCLIIQSSGWLSELYTEHRNRVWYTLLSANIFFLLILIAGTMQIKYGLLIPAGNTEDPTRVGHNDFSLDMYGWKQAKLQFDKFLSDGKRAGPDSTVKIISNKWFPAAHIDFYIAHPDKIDLLVFGNIEAAHKYHWINNSRHITPNDKVYYITSSQNYYDPGELSRYFTRIIPRDTMRIIRNRVIVKNLFIYEMAGFKPDAFAELN